MQLKIRVWSGNDGWWHWYCPCCGCKEDFRLWVMRRMHKSDFYFVGLHIDKYHPRRRDGFVNTYGHWIKTNWTVRTPLGYRCN